MQWQTGGWLKKYLQFRLERPFPPLEVYQKVSHPFADRKELDDCLYEIVQENGVLLGCSYVDAQLDSAWKNCGFPEAYAEILIVYLETLFSTALQEHQLLHAQESQYPEQLQQILGQLLQFYIPELPDDLLASSQFSTALANDKKLHRFIKKLEKVFYLHVHMKKSLWTVGETIQNWFGFLEIYMFLRWNFLSTQQPDQSVSHKEQVGLERVLMKERLILLFEALIWADENVAEVEKKVMQQYINQARLPPNHRNKLKKRLETPVRLEDVDLSIDSDILRKYVLQILVLLSMIDDQQASQEHQLINEVAQRLGVSEMELDHLYISVLSFFADHGHRFEFIKGQSLSELDQYLRNKIMDAVHSSMDKIMVEVRETKELYEILMKATSEPLTPEEKSKAKAQLLDIAKTIPALAIFCLPAGGILLPVIIKVLPFNLLPSAFQEKS